MSVIRDPNIDGATDDPDRYYLKKAPSQVYECSMSGAVGVPRRKGWLCCWRRSPLRGGIIYLSTYGCTCASQGGSGRKEKAGNARGAKAKDELTSEEK